MNDGFAVAPQGLSPLPVFTGGSASLAPGYSLWPLPGPERRGTLVGRVADQSRLDVSTSFCRKTPSTRRRLPESWPRQGPKESSRGQARSAQPPVGNCMNTSPGRGGRPLFGKDFCRPFRAHCFSNPQPGAARRKKPRRLPPATLLPPLRGSNQSFATETALVV